MNDAETVYVRIPEDQLLSLHAIIVKQRNQLDETSYFGLELKTTQILVMLVFLELIKARDSGGKWLVYALMGLAALSWFIAIGVKIREVIRSRRNS